MSNRNSGAIPERRKPKVSLAMTISQGLGGPKEKSKGVSDGQLVNIPALRLVFLEMTEVCNLCELLDFRSLLEETRVGRKLPKGNEHRRATFLENSSGAKLNETVPQNRHRWVGVSTPRRMSETSLRNSAIKRP